MATPTGLLIIHCHWKWLPEQIPLKGLSLDKQWYLHEHIREYCTTEEAADSTCPKPSLLKSVQQNTSAVLPATSELQTENNATTAGKRQQLCSVCHCPGHNQALVSTEVNILTVVFIMYTLLDWIVYVMFCEACTSSHNVHNGFVFGNNKEH